MPMFIIRESLMTALLPRELSQSMRRHDDIFHFRRAA